uniref:Putative ovule protein n=1 Tax=Solanum chacoense TaxID=4108 RepID=A0A0V0H025_SOLCH
MQGHLSHRQVHQLTKATTRMELLLLLCIHLPLQMQVFRGNLGDMVQCMATIMAIELDLSAI